MPWVVPEPRTLLAAAALLALAACTTLPATTPRAAKSPPSGLAASSAAAPSPSPSPEPSYPPYYIESLRKLPHPGAIQVGAQMFRGAGFTKSHMSWPSQGQVMTGTISMPDGPGPFPVVIVNHGHIPVSRYWIGQDSGIFGDPMAAHGFISLAPNYPGYAAPVSWTPSIPRSSARPWPTWTWSARWPACPRRTPGGWR